NITLAIGPEGGWTPFEMNLFEQQNFTPISLGHRILRSDTACVALLAALRTTF
ncbi:MAG: RNA methyltransferase, partial [Kiritimatiellae bacterium]|nr:RNA methyltransferase [Kiritimatiellia bacterium]